MKKLGIVAGNGILPEAICKFCKENNIESYVIAHKDETNLDINTIATKVDWIKLGKLGRILNFFKKNNIKDCVFVGGIRKTSAFKVRPDLKTLKLVFKLKTLNDNELLNAICQELELEGITVHGCQEFLPELLPEEGLLTIRDFTDEEQANLEIGIKAAKTIGDLDIGQAVFIKKRMVIAVEAIEGTDAAISRAGELGKNNQEPILMVKLCKPSQNLRMDLPSIGIQTIENMNKNNIKGLVISAKRTLILEPQGVINLANMYGIVIRSVQ